MIFEGTCDECFLGFGQTGIAERGEDALAGQALRISERFDELEKRGAFDGFGTEKHAGENR